jgi:CheY-like chemotaxis protein
VVDLALPGMGGVDFLRRIGQHPQFERTPVLLRKRPLSPEQAAALREIAASLVLKDVESSERLAFETTLYLHRAESALPEPLQQVLRRVSHADPELAGKRVLLVDDDARNLFAITTILEQHGIDVVYAENGQQALDKLAAPSPFDMVLMDIMMPEMDGYEATRRIRSEARLAQLPVIALTAKAMQGDREKCLEAGASDYITKPVDSHQLVSMLRVWTNAGAPGG